MTDEPNDKSGKPVKAALVLLALLSALAFVAGCKSEPLKPGYLYIDDSLVMFIEWTQTGRKIEGTMEGWERTSYGKVEFALNKFDGVLDGEKVSMTMNFSGSSDGGYTEQGGTITGTLRGNTLALPFLDGARPMEFRRAIFTEYVAAYRNLYIRTAMTMHPRTKLLPIPP
jgi:hypothetical protein